MTPPDQEISDYAAGIFLRYFRLGAAAGAETPHLDLARDLDLLRAHWAVSEPVRTFLAYVLSHRHETQSLLQFERRVDDAVARGRIDARATVLARRVAGHSSLMVFEEPVRSFDTGPNQVVAWVVQTAAFHASRLFAVQPEKSSYSEIIEKAMAEISAVKRLDALREVLKSGVSNRRPGPGALRAAARSRRGIYRLAVEAYEVLADVEAGKETALQRVLRSTLIGPLEPWRRLELAVGLGVGSALSEIIGEPIHLELLGKAAGRPMITCGHYAVFWQGGGGLFEHPPLEPSEERLKRLLEAYGMKLASDRPDLVIVDMKAERAIGIVEVKHTTSDTPDARFREAAGQIVRYARGYVPEGGIDALTRASLIALSHGAPILQNESAPAPRAVDFAGIQAGVLKAWVRDRLLA